MRVAVAMVLVAAAYLVAGKIGLSLAFVHASATAIWPPTGIALAALLILGRRVWPGVFVGAFLVNLTTAGSVGACLGIATGNTLEGVVGAWLVERFASGRRAFDEAGRVARYALLSCVVSTPLAASFGVTALCLDGLATWASAGPIWLTWWLGDLGGALVVAPLIVLWANDWRIRWPLRRGIEAVALVVTMAAVAGTVFTTVSVPLAILAMPLLAWAAVRFGPRETATATCVICVLAVAGTLRGLGPFGGHPPERALLLLDAFVCVLSLTALMLAAAVLEHRRSLAALEAVRGELEQRVLDRTVSLAQTLDAARAEMEERKRAETARQEMEAQLRQGQKLQAIGQLSAGVAHEINNPLGYIISNLDTMTDYLVSLRKLVLSARELVDQPAAAGDAQRLSAEMAELDVNFLLSDFESALKDCREGADRIRHIVAGLRDFARTDRERPAPCDVRQIMEDALRVSAGQFLHRIEIVRNYGPAPVVVGHAKRLEQVFVNLLVNAAQAIEGRGTVTVCTAGEPGIAVVRVKDTGCGIPREHLDKIFEPFFTTKSPHRGTGLGLHISYKIVQAHGGTIAVASEPGTGTEFTIRLPVEGGVATEDA